MASAFLWAVTFVVVLIVVAIGIRIGAAIARVQDLGFWRSIAVAAVLVLVEAFCFSMMTIGASEFGKPLSAILGLGGLVLGVAAPVIILKWMLHQGWGTTLVVWLFHGVAAILGFAAAGAITAPGLIGATEKAAQKRTVSEIKETGMVVEAWLADLPELVDDAAQTGQTKDNLRLDVNKFVVISNDELRSLMESPEASRYREHFPIKDGWGHSIEYRLAYGQDGRVLGTCIRSPGRDGAFESDHYDYGGFDQDDFDRDVVWAHGGFVRWPQ